MIKRAVRGLAASPEQVRGACSAHSIVSDPLMKILRTFLLLVLAASAHAGMPNAEMADALVVSTEKTPGGWVAIVTGPIDIFVADGRQDSGRRVQLYAEKAKIRVPVGNQLYATTGSGGLLYEQRMRDSVGKTVAIQMWGARVVIEGGRVVDVVAGDISFLRPTQAEAAFDLGRLQAIQIR